MVILDELVATDSGIDSETYDRLKPIADAFLAEARQQITRLNGMPRVYPQKELLWSIAPFLRLIFEKYAQPDFTRNISHRRRFAFDALTAVGAYMPSIDEKHLNRLDLFLDAEIPK
jgi:hypothetical protein